MKRSRKHQAQRYQARHYQVRRYKPTRSRKTVGFPLMFAKILLILLFVISTGKILAYFTSSSILANMFTLAEHYQVNFDANGGTGTMASQTLYRNNDANLKANEFTREGWSFIGWNTKADKTGTSYDNEALVQNLTNENEVTLYAQWREGIAEVNGVCYFSLQDAINAVPVYEDKTITTKVTLLANTCEELTVAKGKNIEFDLDNFVVSNKESKAVIENYGTIKITNGTILTSATVTGAIAGAINNYSTGKLVMTGGKIIVAVENGKQAIYNNKGIVEISGDAYLSSTSNTPDNTRATVQNLAGGTLNITGGTIVSVNYLAITNAGTMTIGTKDGESLPLPVIQGGTIGINSTTNFKLYDGIAKGKTKAINDVNKIAEKEKDYEIVNSEETIGGETYKTAHLGKVAIVTFNPNSGTVSETSRKVELGKPIGELPVPTRTGYEFIGWFTTEEGGNQLFADTVIENDLTYYANWQKAIIAKIGDIEYGTLQEAVSAVPEDNTETTVELIKNTTESITVKKGQNIVFDLQNFTITNNGNNPVIENFGTIAISNGTITSDATNATINNKANATITVSGGEILSTGTRSSIYNTGGTVKISGSAYLRSTATGQPDGSTVERGTIHNLDNGTVIITGGTIIGVNQQAISNDAQGNSVVIGEKDGSINTTSPTIMGKTYGIVNQNASALKFYDGTIKGITGAVSGDIAEIEDNSQKTEGTETIDGETYKTLYLTQQ